MPWSVWPRPSKIVIVDEHVDLYHKSCYDMDCCMCWLHSSEKRHKAMIIETHITVAWIIITYHGGSYLDTD